MTAPLSSWTDRVWQDLQPTPERLHSAMRIVVASVLTLLCLLVWQMPFVSLGLYFVFLVGRDSPAISLRSGVFALLALTLAVGAELAIVILSDNDPLVRLLSVAVVAFLAGIFMLSTTLGTLGSIWGLIFCTLIAFWENNVPADALVKNSLWLIATAAVAMGCSIVVEYTFGVSNPAQRLQQQRVVRYQALEAMFTLFAEGAKGDALHEGVIRVSRLAVAGQAGMQQLYNMMVERNLDTGNLPIGTRVRISMLAQLADISAAFGSQNLNGVDSVTRLRCAYIAGCCRDLSHGIVPQVAVPRVAETLTLLDRVEGMLYTIVSMPDDPAHVKRKELVALPSSQAPIFIPGAYKSKETVAFALKLSLCATLCYIFYHAVDWPGISTSTTTVFIAAMSTTGALKQRLIFRFIGSLIGGLILGIGSAAFLFPHMDSVTSLVVLVAAVAFVAAWWATGRQFSYIGVQIAFSFYLVAFEDFRAPTELAPARDRLVGILLALVVMAMVFDLIWPVRTVTIMRLSLASVLRADSELLRLVDSSEEHAVIVQKADGIRDRTGKTVAALRGLNDVVAYEFGVDREEHIRLGDTIIRAAFAAVGLFWNQLAILHSERDRDFVGETGLMEMRRQFAQQIDAMADAVVRRIRFPAADSDSFGDSLLLQNPRFTEYARNAAKQYAELRAIICTLGTQI